MNILIVEDNKATANLLKSFVEAEQDFRDVGVIVYTAHDMDTAIKMTHVRQFSAVILDFVLPDSTWEQTLNRVMEFGCPVIGYSGIADAEMTQSAIRKGCVDVIIKGTPKAVQLMQIGRVLGRVNGGKAARAIYTQGTRLREREEADTTRGGKTKQWLAGNAIAILVALFLIIDHFGGYLGLWRDSEVNGAQLARQVTETKVALETEKKERIADRDEQRGVNKQIIARLDEIRGENSKSTGERDDLKRELTQVHTTIDSIYSILTRK